MSASIRPDPAGGKLWLQVDGVDVLELTPSALKVDGDELAKLTGATFTGDVEIDPAANIDKYLRIFRDFGSGRRRGRAYINGAGHLIIDAANDGAVGAKLTVKSSSDVEINDDPVAEYGSNSNGEYVRFYNGVQVCFVRKLFSGNIDTTNAMPREWARTGDNGFTWPASFDALEAAMVTNDRFQASGDFEPDIFVWGNGLTTSGGNYMLRSPYSRTGVTVDVNIIAIGTWK